MKKYNRKHIGETYKTNEGYNLEVIDGGSKNGYTTCKIEEYRFEAQVSHIKNGIVKYPFHPSILGRGYFGVGKYKASENGKPTKVYYLWGHMLKRVYNKKSYKKHPTYTDVEVCEEWYNFQNFASWFYNESNYKEGWALDKDLLSEKDKKVYSPHTCVFVPQALNNFLTNDKASNTSGCIGVCWYNRDKNWVAHITDIKTGKQKHIGYFTDIEDASKAYKNERGKYAQIWKNRMRGILPDNVIKAIA